MSECLESFPLEIKNEGSEGLLYKKYVYINGCVKFYIFYWGFIKSWPNLLIVVIKIWRMFACVVYHKSNKLSIVNLKFVNNPQLIALFYQFNLFIDNVRKIFTSNEILAVQKNSNFFQYFVLSSAQNNILFLLYIWRL